MKAKHRVYHRSPTRNIHSKKFCVLVPMYNEEAGAARCLKSLISIQAELHRIFDIIVINDGSQDETTTIVNTFTHRYPKRIIALHHKKNRGYGAALATGIRYGYQHSYQYAVCIDSDLTNDPHYLSDFFALANSNFDCVKASRYITGGGMRGVPLYRQFISRLGNQIASRCFNMGIKDCTNGFRMLKLATVKDLRYQEKGFASILEELLFLKKKQAKCVEIPNVLTSRTDTETNFRYTPATFWSYLKYAILAIKT